MENNRNTKIIDIINRNDIIITDGGLETTLIYKHNIDLPYFSCINLLKTDYGKNIIYNYFLNYINISKKYNVRIIIETPTWRCSKKWCKLLNCENYEIEKINQEAVNIVKSIKKNNENIIISGNIGPIDDGYVINNKLTIEELKEYHLEQIYILAKENVDMISAFTINYVEEAMGIVLACKNINIPLVISFTVGINGKLPSGMTLEDSIKYIDKNTNYYPIYYMINCAHPKHFISLFKNNSDWIKRIKGIRSNASDKSHEELNNSTELDIGNIDELSNYCKNIRNENKHINIFGGCCGTDENHVENILIKCLN